MAYRGKYPERINTVYIGKPYGGALCVTNGGKKFVVTPISREGQSRAPQPNQDIARFMLMTTHYTVKPFEQ